MYLNKNQTNFTFKNVFFYICRDSCLTFNFALLGKICGTKYPELTPPGPVLCLRGTDEKACPAPIFTYAPLFECVVGYQCCSLVSK